MNKNTGDFFFKIDREFGAKFRTWANKNEIDMTDWFVKKIATDLQIAAPKRQGLERVKVTLIDTGEVSVYKSQRAASIDTGVNRVTMRNYLDTGKPLDGYLFESDSRKE